MENTVTLTLARYEDLKEKEEALKAKATVIRTVSWERTRNNMMFLVVSYEFTGDNEVIAELTKTINAQQKEIDSSKEKLDESINLMREAAEAAEAAGELLEIKGKWWYRIFGRERVKTTRIPSGEVRII